MLFMLLLFLYEIYNIIDGFKVLVVFRRGMDLIWGGRLGQNVWSIGQVGAVFSTAPLIIEMVYSIPIIFKEETVQQNGQESAVFDTDLETGQRIPTLSFESLVLNPMGQEGGDFLV